MIIHTEFDRIGPIHGADEMHLIFGLIWITPWTDKNDLFLKLVIHEIRKFQYVNLFFSRQAIPQFPFILDSRYKWYTPYRVWFNWKNFSTLRKRYIFTIGYFRNLQIPYENLTFFKASYTKKSFSFKLYLNLWYSMPSLVCLKNSWSRW